MHQFLWIWDHRAGMDAEHLVEKCGVRVSGRVVHANPATRSASASPTTRRTGPNASSCVEAAPSPSRSSAPPAPPARQSPGSRRQPTDRRQRARQAPRPHRPHLPRHRRIPRHRPIRTQPHVARRAILAAHSPAAPRPRPSPSLASSPLPLQPGKSPTAPVGLSPSSTSVSCHSFIFSSSTAGATNARSPHQTLPIRRRAAPAPPYSCILDAVCSAALLPQHLPHLLHQLRRHRLCFRRPLFPVSKGHRQPMQKITRSTHGTRSHAAGVAPSVASSQHSGRNPMASNNTSSTAIVLMSAPSNSAQSRYSHLPYCTHCASRSEACISLTPATPGTTGRSPTHRPAYSPLACMNNSLATAPCAWIFTIRLDLGRVQNRMCPGAHGPASHIQRRSRARRVNAHVARNTPLPADSAPLVVRRRQ